MKKIVSILLIFVLTISIGSVTVFATEVTANPTNSKITVNGVEVKFDAYNINGNNYFKLRDIAYVLSDTKSCFSVNWDAVTNSANLITGEKYSPVGGEMGLGDNIQKKAVLSNTNIMVNNEKVTATAYLINNNNYFKLRDLGSILNFEVDWDEVSQTVIIKSVVNEAKQEEDFEFITTDKVELGITQFNHIYNSSRDSSIQQFLYKDEGIAYAYVENDTEDLEIVLPSSRLTIKMLYSKLGDIISDENGCIYIIWGKISEIENSERTNNVFISKYSPNGILIKTAEFSGQTLGIDDSMIEDPFHSGNTVSAINNGILTVQFAKKMYNGHQSNVVISVNISDLSPIDKWNNVYTSHSFGHDVIWSERYQNYYYVSHGDAFPRGFNLATNNYQKTLFNFYLQNNANNNMIIINQTFAQMGGLIESDKSFVFCGASAKSISEDAKNEVQNLFIQMFNINNNNEIEFIGGEDRTGYTATDIQDNSNSPLTSVTNNGVRWLTDYAENSVIAPQIVQANDKIVILWSVYNPHNRFCEDRYYMILSDTGEILVPETPLKEYLNSYEKPIYHDGVVSWVYYDHYNKQIKQAKIQIN